MTDFQRAFETIKEDALLVSNNQKRCPIVERTTNTVKESIENNKLILFGCGAGGVGIATFFNELGIKISGVCDSYKNGIFAITGHNIMTPIDLYENHLDAIVLISSRNFENEILSNLISSGFPADRIVTYPWDIIHDQKPTNLADLYRPYFAKQVLHILNDFEQSHYDGFEYAYNMFSDETSRGVVIMMVRRLLFEEIITRSSDSPQYFEKRILQLEDNEVFIDAGACYGDTTAEFIRQCQQNNVTYKHIVAFEPMDKIAQSMFYLPDNIKNFELIEKGLWHENTELRFTICDQGTSTAVLTRSEDNEVIVPVTSLDLLFEERPKSDWPTFIKMDIEGSEPNALIGAKRIISEKRPKLAICVYHKPEHLYQVLAYIDGFDLDYKFALRQYEDGLNEQVLYCY